MIDKFKKFVEAQIYNQLCYYNITHIEGTGVRFFLTAYEDDYEYVKRQVCHFIASWDAPIYVSMSPKAQRIIVDIWEERS